MKQNLPALEPGTRIDTLRIERVLGLGSSGITYLVSDTLTGGTFALKEYLPGIDTDGNPEFGMIRLPGGALQASSSDEQQRFNAGMQEFLAQGRVLAGLQHPHIIKVIRSFEANRTAYLQMPYYRGESLARLLEQGNSFDQQTIEPILFPLLDALRYLHDNSITHQDIKPANIYITENGEPLLLDFGAALGKRSPGTSHPARQGSPGYAAPEQERGSGAIGPWTDIYGLAACLYRLVAAKLPIPASQRAAAVAAGMTDPLTPITRAAVHGVPAAWLEAIDQGLSLKPEKRPRDISAWQDAFLRGASARPPIERKRPSRLPVTDSEYTTEGRAWLPTILLGSFLLLFIALVIYLVLGGTPGGDSGGDSVQPGQPREAAPITRDPEQNRRWLQALEADTVYAYQRYLQDYPGSINEADALQHLARLDDDLWQSTEQEASRLAYENYLQQFPQGRHEADARIRLDVLDQTNAEAERQRQLRLQQDQLAWNEARMQRSIAAIDAYLAAYPDGQHIDEAQELRRQLSDTANDSTAFAAAQKLATRKAYQAYIDAFPRGSHVTEALTAIDDLTLRPGKRFRDCEQCPELVVLPAGSFWQGATEEAEAALANEKPQRKVVIQKAFAMGIHEVTLSQWDACSGEGACATQPPDNDWGRGSRPAIMVSWNDAQAYVEWLSKKTGQRYRLPSESEWEYAARAGETDQWPGGEPTEVCQYGNIAGSETGFRWAHEACADPFSLETAPAGSFPANRFGLHDVIGNVAEWTLDCMSLSYLDAPADGSANSRGLCNSRVTRGGSWFSGARESRLTARFNLKSGDRNDFTGFRVLRELPADS